MDRIGGNISILATEADLDDNKIVDVLEIVPDEVLGMLWRTILDNQVSGSTNSYLVGNMPWQDELTIVPSDLNLKAVSTRLVV